jgi:uncharacterized protein YjbJ (UPF0337 family)
MDYVFGQLEAVQGQDRGEVGDLTDDELDQAAGKRDQVIAALQERYGYERDRAERVLDEYTRTWSETKTGIVRKPGSAP